MIKGIIIKTDGMEQYPDFAGSKVFMDDIRAMVKRHIHWSLYGFTVDGGYSQEQIDETKDSTVRVYVDGKLKLYYKIEDDLVYTKYRQVWPEGFNRFLERFADLVQDMYLDQRKEKQEKPKSKWRFWK